MPLLTYDDRIVFRIWVRDGLQQHAPLARTSELAEAGRRNDPGLCVNLVDLGLFGRATRTLHFTTSATPSDYLSGQDDIPCPARPGIPLP